MNINELCNVVVSDFIKNGFKYIEIRREEWADNVPSVTIGENYRELVWCNDSTTYNANLLDMISNGWMVV